MASVTGPGEDVEADLGLSYHSCTIYDRLVRIPLKYSATDVVGQGAYGTVYSAMAHPTEDTVAIKQMENAFAHASICKGILRELRILRCLQHENIIRVQDVFINDSKLKYTDLNIVSELMETDLMWILRSPQHLSDSHSHFFLYQILRGVKYIHSAQIIHRDIKPRNLLVNSNCDLKICDFGLARVTFADKDVDRAPLTEYIYTRWYRAPEILCFCPDYSYEIDLWAIGCTFAEMITRKPLFPGRTSQHQIHLISAMLATQSEEGVDDISSSKWEKVVREMPAIPSKSLLEHCPDATVNTLNLLQWMLRFNPAKRATACDALDHAYMAELHYIEDEPSRDPLDQHDFEFERRKLTLGALREELFREVLHYHPQKQEEYLRTNTTYCVKNYRLLEHWEVSCDTDGNISTDEAPSNLNSISPTSPSVH
eukprot:GEMP01025993.1.p1 GENE.GEMP01025993.1~~GEMP01025993.1.p1  ORF type:complete len:426 (+),score=66.24 GEMP01025993.1:279-1556(+)